MALHSATPMFVHISGMKASKPAGSVIGSEPLNVMVGATTIRSMNASLQTENQKLREQVALAEARNKLLEERSALLAWRRVQQHIPSEGDVLPPPGLTAHDKHGADASEGVSNSTAASSLDEAKTIKSVNASLHRENQMLREQVALKVASNKMLQSKRLLPPGLDAAIHKADMPKQKSDVSDSASTTVASSCCESDSDVEFCGDGLQSHDERSTVIMRNIPSKCSRSQLLALFEKAGFKQDLAMIYLPMDFSTQAAFGYAFITLTSSESAIRFLQHFNGFSDWERKCAAEKICSVSWCAEHEHLDVHIERYRNSPVMHETVPDSYKPVLFSGGERIPFPSPTKHIRKPRVLGGRQTWHQ